MQVAYVPEWQSLPEALVQMMAAVLSRAEAQVDICHAISDGTVRIRVRPKKHAKTQMTSKRVVDGGDVEIPPLTPKDFEWEASRPLRPWPIRFEVFHIRGAWFLERIEVSRTNVMQVLCRPPEQRALASEPAPRTLTCTTHVGETALESQDTARSAGRGAEAQQLKRGGPTRRTGPRPIKCDQTK